MGLLSKALEYRRKYLQHRPKGLLARALVYREKQNKIFFPPAEETSELTSIPSEPMISPDVLSDISNRGKRDSFVEETDSPSIQQSNPVLSSIPNEPPIQLHFDDEYNYIDINNYNNPTINDPEDYSELEEDYTDTEPEETDETIPTMEEPFTEETETSQVDEVLDKMPEEIDESDNEEIQEQLTDNIEDYSELEEDYTDTELEEPFTEETGASQVDEVLDEVPEETDEADDEEIQEQLIDNIEDYSELEEEDYTDTEPEEASETIPAMEEPFTEETGASQVDEILDEANEADNEEIQEQLTDNIEDCSELEEDYTDTEPEEASETIPAMEEPFTKVAETNQVDEVLDEMPEEIDESDNEEIQEQLIDNIEDYSEPEEDYTDTELEETSETIPAMEEPFTEEAEASQVDEILDEANEADNEEIQEQLADNIEDYSEPEEDYTDTEPEETSETIPAMEEPFTEEAETTQVDEVLDEVPEETDEAGNEEIQEQLIDNIEDYSELEEEDYTDTEPEETSETIPAMEEPFTEEAETNQADEVLNEAPEETDETIPAMEEPFTEEAETNQADEVLDEMPEEIQEQLINDPEDYSELEEKDYTDTEPEETCETIPAMEEPFTEEAETNQVDEVLNEAPEETDEADNEKIQEQQIDNIEDYSELEEEDYTDTEPEETSETIPAMKEPFTEEAETNQTDEVLDEVPEETDETDNEKIQEQLTDNIEDYSELEEACETIPAMEEPFTEEAETNQVDEVLDEAPEETDEADNEEIQEQLIDNIEDYSELEEEDYTDTEPEEASETIPAMEEPFTEEAEASQVDEVLDEMPEEIELDLDIPDEIDLHLQDRIDELVEETSSSIQEEKDYFEIINALSLRFPKITQGVDSLYQFHEITTEEFGFDKSALLLYSPSRDSFVCSECINIHPESVSKLQFNLEFEDLYRIISKNGFFAVSKKEDNLELLPHFLAEKDYAESDFLILVPYIFSSRIIGLFAGFRLAPPLMLTEKLQEALSLVCRLNGALLYNFYQNETLSRELNEYRQKMELQKEMAAAGVVKPETTEEPSGKEVKKNETANEVPASSSKLFQDPIEQGQSAKEEPSGNELSNKRIAIENNKEDVDLSELFDKKYHKIIFYLKKTIEQTPESPLSIIKIRISNSEKLEKEIEGFKINVFISDIQFVVMNIVGTNGLVSMFDDFSIYAILPETEIETAKMIQEQIESDIRGMFSEIFGASNVEFNNIVVNYPSSSNNFVELFYMAQNDQ